MDWTGDTVQYESVIIYVILQEFILTRSDDSSHTTTQPLFCAGQQALYDMIQDNTIIKYNY